MLGNCAWFDGEGCSVSNAYLREAYLADIDEDSHPICHLFVITDHAACGEQNTARRCEADDQCVWDSADGMMLNPSSFFAYGM